MLLWSVQDIKMKGITTKELVNAVKTLSENRQYVYVIGGEEMYVHPYPGDPILGEILCFKEKDKEECFLVYRVSKKYRKAYLKKGIIDI